ISSSKKITSRLSAGSVSLVTVSLVSFMGTPSCGAWGITGETSRCFPMAFPGTATNKECLESYRKTRVAVFPGMRWPRVPSGSMQQEADRRLPQSRKLHARALPAARHRRDGEGALLRHQLLVDRAAQSHGHHPEGNAGRLHRAARSRPACELG